MIVRSLQEAEKTERRVVTPNWESTRLLLENDHMGFSFHITTVYAGTETSMWYRHHLESVYCISGYGELEASGDARVYSISPGTIYVLDKNDKHVLRAKTEMKLACAFNPPLRGKETHDETGAYPLNAEPVGL